MNELPSDRRYMPSKKDDPCAGGNSGWLDSGGGKRPWGGNEPFAGGSVYGVDDIGPYVDRVIDTPLVPGTEKWIPRYRPVYERHYFRNQENAANTIGRLLTRRAIERDEQN